MCELNIKEEPLSNRREFCLLTLGCAGGSIEHQLASCVGNRETSHYTYISIVEEDDSLLESAHTLSNENPACGSEGVLNLGGEQFELLMLGVGEELLEITHTLNPVVDLIVIAERRTIQLHFVNREGRLSS